MMIRPFDVPVCGDSYRVLESPEELVDADGAECNFQLDHADQVIWLAPGLSVYAHRCLIPLAVSECWEERLAAAGGAGARRVQ